MRTVHCGALRIMSAILAALLLGAGILAFPARADVLGVDAIAEALPVLDEVSRHMRDPQPWEEFPPMRVLLSRSRYWAQDGHLDAVVQLNEEAPGGELRVRILSPGGRELMRSAFPVPGQRFVFYPAIPPALAEGGEAVFETVWADGGRTLAQDSQPFRVEVFDGPAPRAGRIRLHVPNVAGASLRAVPARVGVPFPRGLLVDVAHLRLVDAAGAEVPLQVEQTARWSRFGSVKWALCSFAADLDGGPGDYYLEYGPDVRRIARPNMGVEHGAGFPVVDAGRLRFDRGVWFDPEGDGNFVKVLGEQALSGAFVEHEDGRIYRAPLDDEYLVEESGPEKTVLRREGWYKQEDGDREFCKYVTRYFLHRNSPAMKIEHTWIFTGDGNADRIRNMGWRFDLDERLSPAGFLGSFGEPDAWMQGDYLLQHDYELYDLVGADGERRDAEGRLPGVMAASGGGARVMLGVRDFWQNFPSELEFADGAMWFHNWPRHGREPRHPSPTLDDAIRLWFVHEGVMLDFRLPDEFLDGPIYEAMTAGDRRSFHYERNRPETANAQGIARTEEMWLWFAPQGAPAEACVGALEELNHFAPLAAVDPERMAASGAFYEIHHRDMDQYPEYEAIYEEHALAPGRWNERVGLYGMWLHGDTLHAPNLRDRSAGVYRGLRKAHHGWPYSWVPFVRSGDPRFLRLAHAGTRQMYDANHCHYATEDIDISTGENHPRRIGVWFRSHVPWAGRRFGPTTRSYQNEGNYLWDAHFVTGDRRALDVLQAWMEAVKVEENILKRDPISIGWRRGITMLKAFVETYEATNDPWFLAAAHAMAQLDILEHTTRGWLGHAWQPGPREFLRFSGCEDYKAFYLAYARDKGGESSLHWPGKPQIEMNAYAWWVTGDEYHLRRLAGEVDWARQSTFVGDVEWYRGLHISRFVSAGPLNTSWFLYEFPLALAAFEATGGEPAGAIPRRFPEAGSTAPQPAEDGFRHALPWVAFRKPAGEAVPVSLSLGAREGDTGRFSIRGPDDRVWEGQWDAHEEHRVLIPADAPAGTYWLAVSAHTPQRRAARLVLPTTPPGVPEVLVDEKAEFPSVGTMGTGWSQYWFLMPEAAETFEAEFTFQGGREYHRRPVRRASLWDGDGRLAWDRNVVMDHIETYDESVQVIAEIQVPPEQRDRVWRMTMPGDGLAFRILSPDVRPVFAFAPGRWFDPGEPPE